MKLKIVSGGLARNTHVYNADTGEELQGVRNLWLKVGIDESVAIAILEVVDVQLEMTALQIERKLTHAARRPGCRLRKILARCKVWLQSKNILKHKSPGA